MSPGIGEDDRLSPQLTSDNGIARSRAGVLCLIQQKTGLQSLSDEYLVLPTKLFEDGTSLRSCLADAASSAKKGYGAFQTLRHICKVPSLVDFPEFKVFDLPPGKGPYALLPIPGFFKTFVDVTERIHRVMRAGTDRAVSRLRPVLYGLHIHNLLEIIEILDGRAVLFERHIFKEPGKDVKIRRGNIRGMKRMHRREIDFHVVVSQDLFPIEIFHQQPDGFKPAGMQMNTDDRLGFRLDQMTKCPDCLFNVGAPDGVTRD